MIKTNEEPASLNSHHVSRFDLDKLKKENAVVYDVKGVLADKAEGKL